MVLAWDVPSLVEARGFLEYEVTYESVAGEGGRRRRQQVSSACAQSPCNVPVEEGRVTVVGLDPEADYSVVVQPVNEENERGDSVRMTGMCVYMCRVMCICMCVLQCQRHQVGAIFLCCQWLWVL